MHPSDNQASFSARVRRRLLERLIAVATGLSLAFIAVVMLVAHFAAPGDAGLARAAMAAAVFITFVTVLCAYPIAMKSLHGLVTLAGNLLQANIETAQVLGSAIAKRDSDTSEHNFRVTIVSVRIAQRCGLDRETIRNLIKGAFVHDLGKIAISDAILLKPGRLTPAEFEVMKNHVREGVEMLERSVWLADAVHVVRHHHEKYDGSGYVAGLKGEEIPIAARIFALADVFDALTSRRPYKEPLSFEHTMDVLEEGAGTHFDPRILAAFAPIASEIYRDLVAAPPERPGVVLRQIVHEYFSHPASELKVA